MKGNRKAGFTLIEMIIALSLIVMVITLSTSMIGLTVRAHEQTVSEYEINTTIRVVSQQTNEIIRYSKALFAVPAEFVSNVNNMDPGWVYFGVSSDRRRIVNYVYDTALGHHVEEILVDESPNVEYEILFEKDTASSNENMLKFSIVGYVISEDAEGNIVRTGEKVVLESEVEAQNSLQVVDKGTAINPSVALAYRNDSSAQGTGRTQVATITLVLDVSGSMDDALGGSTRIQHLKNSLLGYTKDDGTVVEGIINTFSRENNIEICVVPFSQTANYPEPDSYSNQEHPFYNAKDDKSTLTTLIQNMDTYGSTNTGDGLRRAYYRLEDFNAASEGYNALAEQYSYMIVLVDGMTNQSPWSGYGYYWWIFPQFSRSSQFYNRGGIYPQISYDSVVRVYPQDYQNTTYVQTMGGTINAAGVNSYVIGFASGLTSEINLIGNAVNAKQVYNYNDDFDLDEVFENIANDILAELWLLTGPQIIE